MNINIAKRGEKNMSTSTEKQVKKFNNYMCGLLGYAPEYNFTDKQQCIRQHISYMLNRTQSMFEWKNLPETIPERSLELYLQTNGNVCFYNYENSL